MPSIAATPSSTAFSMGIDNTTNLINTAGVPDVPAFPDVANTFTTGQTFTTQALTGKITSYNGITTAGTGVPIILASYINTSTSTSLANIINYTPPASVGTYRVCANIATTTGTNSGTTTVTVGHTSTSGVAITYLPPFSQSGSATQLTAATASSKSFSTVAYTFNIDTSATAITVSTTVTGTVAEAVSATLEQLY